MACTGPSSDEATSVFAIREAGVPTTGSKEQVQFGPLVHRLLLLSKGGRMHQLQHPTDIAHGY